MLLKIGFYSPPPLCVEFGNLFRPQKLNLTELCTVFTLKSKQRMSLHSYLVLNSGFKGCPSSPFNCSLTLPLKCGSRDLSFGYPLPGSTRNLKPLGAKTCWHSIQLGSAIPLSRGTSRPSARDFLEFK